MSNIIEFPINNTEKNATSKKELEKVLENKGADQELVDFALKRFDFHTDESEKGKFRFQLELDSSIASDIGKNIAAQVQECIDQLCANSQSEISNLKAQLILAEIKAFQLERNT